MRWPKTLQLDAIMKTIRPEKSDEFEGEMDENKERLRRMAAAANADPQPQTPPGGQSRESITRVKKFFGFGKK